VITGLSCSLAQEERTVRIDWESRLGRIYGRDRARERFNCTAGLNEHHREAFLKAGLVISAQGEEGEARALEIPGHPFYLATLYLPQLSSTVEKPHPLLTAFLRAAAGIESPA
jgi:CTP synthase (UTP-ammonia lyase)